MVQNGWRKGKKTQSQNNLLIGGVYNYRADKKHSLKNSAHILQQLHKENVRKLDFTKSRGKDYLRRVKDIKTTQGEDPLLTS